MSKIKLFSLCLLLVFTQTLGRVLIFKTIEDKYNVHIYTYDNKQVMLEITTTDGIYKQEAQLGMNVNAEAVRDCPDEDDCFIFDDITLQIGNYSAGAFSIAWTTERQDAVLQDCLHLNSTHVDWYGGPEWLFQLWPVQKTAIRDFDVAPQEAYHAAIFEGYWVNSKGIYLYIHKRVPAFVDQHFGKGDHLCVSAKNASPYRQRDKLVLRYTIGVADDARAAHLHAVGRFLRKPSGHPNVDVIKHPIWSTWARYYRDINDSVILNFAQEIADQGYTGQFEIDDDWEKCYGSFEFNEKKFPDIKNSIQKIKAMNFTTSLWLHPFVNDDCVEPRDVGLEKGYFVKNTHNSTRTSWWNSGFLQAHHIDYTKKEARDWLNEKLNALREDIGIDTFKFDAGEISWAPQPAVIQGDPEHSPQKMTTEFVNNCALYGDRIEIRTGWRTQTLPVLVRMIDKDSNWGRINGLYTLITTLLQMNMNGYTMVLPDMVGGNGYNNQKPTAELFVRWLQANTFMPTIQFSFVPWDYKDHVDFDVMVISKKFVELHAKFLPEIIRAMNASVEHGYPVNGPIWWVDPHSKRAQEMDTEFLLGEDIIVAPIVIEGATQRDVYLPQGTWIDGNTGVEHDGDSLIVDYAAPIDVLPYFVRTDSKAAGIIKS